jgi:leucyl aminopeptidase
MAFNPGQDALSALVAQAQGRATSRPRPASCCSYMAPGVAARVVLVGRAMGRARRCARPWLQRAGVLKGPAKRLRPAVFCSAASEAAAVRAAVQAVADASYVYTTTKPKADALGKRR